MSTQTFHKSDRLLSSPQFQAVFGAPIKKLHSTHLLVFLAKSSAEQPRLGLAITKKKLKNATDRNRLKRQIRETFRQQKVQLPALDMVFIVKSSFDDSVDIAAQIAELFRKINKLNQNQQQ